MQKARESNAELAKKLEKVQKEKEEELKKEQELQAVNSRAQGELSATQHKLTTVEGLEK